MHIGQCRLCQKDGVGLVNSHIIPNYVTKRMKNEKGIPNKYYILERDIHKDNRIGQGGIKEHLLCEACDNNLISLWENYARNFFFELPISYRKIQPNLSELSGINYNKLKLFLLSILWRSSVSSDRFFEQVQLGPHQEAIRKMLITGNPGIKTDYPCLINRVVAPTPLGPDYLVQPRLTRFGHHRVYDYVFLGFNWMFFIAKDRFPEPLKELFLNEEGKVKVWDVRLTEMGKTWDFFRNLHQQGKLAHLNRRKK